MCFKIFRFRTVGYNLGLWYNGFKAAGIHIGNHAVGVMW